MRTRCVVEMMIGKRSNMVGRRVVRPLRLLQQKNRTFAASPSRGERNQHPSPSVSSSTKDRDGNPSNFVFSLLSWYSRKLDTHPLLTKGASSGLIAGAADYICQMLFDNDTSETEATPTSEQQASIVQTVHWDRLRTGRFVLLGVVLVTPVTHFWYSALATRILPGAGVVTVVKRVLLDQFFMAPLFITAWLGSMWTLEGDSSLREIPDRILQAMPTVLVANWALWMPAMAVNFMYVRLKYQVLFSNVVAFLWNVYLSYVTNRQHTKSIATREQVTSSDNS
jgi:hypothetical protein